MEIILTTNDIEVNSTSDSGRLIDDVALACGYDEWDSIEMDLYRDQPSYSRDHYNYSEKFLAILNGYPKTTSPVDGPMTYVYEVLTANNYTVDIFDEWSASPLLFGAFLKLTYPAIFNGALRSFRSMIDDLGADDLADIIPELAKEIEDEENEYYKEQRKEWLRGDYHGSFDGIIPLFRKLIEADDIKYDDASDTMHITIDIEEAKELYDDYGDGAIDTYEMTIEDLKEQLSAEIIKKSILTLIENKSGAYRASEKIKKDARMAEYAKTRQYQQEQREASEKAERERLEAMTK